MLKDMENLSKNGFDRLMDLTEISGPLYQDYLLKEDLRMFWAFDNEKSGRNFLWIIGSFKPKS
jgi:hypothetical protein